MLLQLAALGLAASPTSVEASGQDLFGLGARAAALGGSASAVDGFEAVYHNPAALADERGRQLTFGLIGSRPDLTVDGDARPAPNEEAVLIGVVLPIPLLGTWRDRIGLGLGVRLPTDVVVSASVPPLGTPHLGLLEQRSRTVGVHLSLGGRVSDRLAIGAGVLALAALEGRIDVKPTPEGPLTSTVENELLADYAPIASVLLGPWDAFRGAVTWRAESIAGFDVPLDADLGESACFIGICLGVPVMDISGVAQYDPAQVRGDVRWDDGPWMVTAGATWRRWSARPLSIQPVVAGSPDHGSLGFTDTFSPSVAGQWATENLRVRGSVGFEPSPAPADARPGGMLDTDRAVAVAGVGWTLGVVTFDGFVGMHALIGRTQTVPAGEVKVAGRILVAGLQLGVTL